MTIMLTLNPVRTFPCCVITVLTQSTVVNVMKRDLVVIFADGMDVPHLEEILQSTDYRGFPVVKSQTDATVLGFIRKTELRFSLGKFGLSTRFSFSLTSPYLITDRIRRRREDASSLICTFQNLDGEDQQRRPSQPQTELDGSPHIDNQPGAAFIGANGQNKIDLGQYVDQVRFLL